VKVTRDAVSAIGAAIAEQSVEMSYDPVGRLLRRWKTSGGEMIASSTTYDTAGRMSSESTPGQGTISYSYDVSNRVVTGTLPTGATRIETRYLDGRLASVTGSLQVPEYYDYGVETDGRRRSTVSALTSGGPRTALSRLDLLGRPLERSRPGFNNGEAFTESTGYDPTTGLPTLLSRTGYSPTRLEYDGMGVLKRRGLLLNAGSSLLEASSDRITDLETKFESYNGAYWVTSRTWVYATTDSATRTLVGTNRERVTGLSQTLRAETRTTDVDGNETIRTVNVDSANQLDSRTFRSPRPAMTA
jgi:YD repeat-containing protein